MPTQLFTPHASAERPEGTVHKPQRRSRRGSAGFVLLGQPFHGALGEYSLGGLGLVTLFE